MSDDVNEARAGRLLAGINPVNPLDFIRVEANHQEAKAAEAEILRLKVLVDTLKAECALLYKNCNHVFEDGTSAWKGGFMFSACEICGENDL